MPIIVTFFHKHKTLIIGKCKHFLLQRDTVSGSDVVNSSCMKMFITRFEDFFTLSLYLLHF